MASIRSGIGENMTESEAIEELKYDCNELGKAIPCDTSWGSSFENAYGMAIQALEKQIKLNEIGDCYIIPKNGIFEVNGVDVNRAIQKNIPKKPRKTNSYSGVFKRVYAYVCPACGNARLEKYINERQNTMFCWNCGQKLDWSDEE